ncbi:hypothetical protein [Metabacillus malikii]|uniref:Vacuolar-type H+-ATPase subunit I/STV1 n=1 Tax=Metabacillus malikii TaxID=1504265 RepID=A0ABT9ZIP4_9BACI|nr:hypothetical protein [Metabacillus malikii]MDQ0231682.1 vacuolar-type H+-ATPase subunit I/STV1 [Metabacillus malikii]
MFSEINEQLIEIQGHLRKKDKYEAQLEDYKDELEAIEHRLAQLESRLQSEQEDVEKLERFSLTNLFATLSGKKDEKLSVEKQEYLAAKHKLEEAKKTRVEIDDAMILISEKLIQLENAEYRYQQLLKQKEEMIKTSSTPYTEKIFELSSLEGRLQAYIIELDEAINAGQNVKNSLQKAITSLEKAENWGTWDMLGGGTITGMVKHQHIDEAEKSLHQAQTRMRQFQKELLDVQETAQIEVNISDMLKFADFFFDGFIADYMVQGKINRSLEQAKQQNERVHTIVQGLENQYDEKNRELKRIQQEKQHIIEKL